MNINKQPIKTTIRIKTTALVGFLLPLHATLHAGEATPAQPPPTAAHEVSLERMQKVYDEVKTPYKYGVVIRGEANQLVDSPSVFRKDGQWYMVYVTITGKVGYETCLARSADLVNWTKWTGPDLVKSSFILNPMADGIPVEPARFDAVAAWVRVNSPVTEQWKINADPIIPFFPLLKH